MSVCPRCRSQYSAAGAKCPSCNVLLLTVVDGNAVRVSAAEAAPAREPSEEPSNRLLLLLEEPLPEMAAMIREFLHNCGIDCIVHSESIGLLYRLPAPGAPISRARLYVRESDWHEARELVTNFFKKT